METERSPLLICLDYSISPVFMLLSWRVEKVFGNLFPDTASKKYNLTFK